uniref:CSON007757 protein n=1 Tax=Culicoides sonorensis TaxID=179676 RepID=A0A336MVL1_CULSO
MEPPWPPRVQIPSNLIRKRAGSISSIHSTKTMRSAKSNNVYNDLEDNVEENELMQINNNSDTHINNQNSDKNKKQSEASEKSKNQTIIDKNNDNSNTHSNQKNAKDYKPPPITFKDTTIDAVKNILKEVECIDMKHLTIRITAEGIKIQMTKMSDYDALLDRIIDDKSVLFHTHTKKQERKVKFCLYGLHRMNFEELNEELKSVGVFPRLIEEIPIYERKYKDQCIYKITFFQEDHVNVSKLRQVKALCHTIVRWEYFKSKFNFPTRCTNCQEWGHGARYCYTYPKCSRCAGPHRSSDCPHEKDDDHKIPPNLVKCANCGKNHTASFTGCAKRYNYVNLQQRMKENSRKNSKFQQKSSPQPDTSNFPHYNNDSVRKSVNVPSTPHPPPNYWENRNTNNLNNNKNSNKFNSKELIEVFHELIEKLEKCQTAKDQVTVLGELVIKYVYGKQP